MDSDSLRIISLFLGITLALYSLGSLLNGIDDKSVISLTAGLYLSWIGSKCEIISPENTRYFREQMDLYMTFISETTERFYERKERLSRNFQDSYSDTKLEYVEEIRNELIKNGWLPPREKDILDRCQQGGTLLAGKPIKWSPSRKYDTEDFKSEDVKRTYFE
jgi:hypothetical protein